MATQIEPTVRSLAVDGNPFVLADISPNRGISCYPHQKKNDFVIVLFLRILHFCKIYIMRFVKAYIMPLVKVVQKMQNIMYPYGHYVFCYRKTLCTHYGSHYG